MSSARARQPGELIFVVLLVVFSLLAAWQAWTIAGFSSPSSPGVFPMFASAAMVISGLFVLAGTAHKKPTVERAGPAEMLASVTPLRLIFFSAMIVAYMLALEPAGFLISSFVFLFASIAYLHRGHILLTLVVSAASLAVIYVIFRHVFAVVLPAGRLF